jgi:NRAMP (natural resistance-associated macrophage protein)-like metal ion transporter
MENDERSISRQIITALGPGIITGAADDDPSGIGTYSVAGAQFGFAFLWSALITWPLMAAVQMACARIGMVTGCGLASALERKFPRGLVITACGCLFIANALNVGADLSAMGDSAHMLTGLPTPFFILLFGGAISWATVQLSYRHIAAVLKWLAVALMSYVVVAFILQPDWSVVLKATLHPTLPQGSAGWGMLVAILGTTISPYLFFWQAAQEVEEDKAHGRTRLRERRGSTPKELFLRRWDVGAGTFFSNIVMFFIILATALTLNKHGITKIETSTQAAEALRPIAGHFAFLLYTVGLLGVGFLAIPTLTGSTAFAMAETFRWRRGLDLKLRRAKYFYAVILASMLFGILFNFADINPLKALYWSAVLNGLLAPFLLFGIVFVISDEKIMNGQPSSRLVQIVVSLTTLLMFGAGIAMFVV